MIEPTGAKMEFKRACARAEPLFEFHSSSECDDSGFGCFISYNYNNDQVSPMKGKLVVYRSDQGNFIVGTTYQSWAPGGPLPWCEVSVFTDPMLAVMLFHSRYIHITGKSNNGLREIIMTMFNRG